MTGRLPDFELSIDSSTRYASVAVSQKGVAITERTWRAEQNHSIELAPAIRELMSEVSVAPANLGAIFVAKGPGGFSALRVGIATAKGLAMGLRIRLVAVGTLQVEMALHLPCKRPVCAIVEGGGSRLYAAWSNGAPDDFDVLTIEELTERTTEPTVFCGEGAFGAAPVLMQRLGPLADVRMETPPTRRASTLAELAFARLQSGESDDPDTLEPLYMRSAQYDVASKTRLG